MNPVLRPILRQVFVFAIAAATSLLAIDAVQGTAWYKNRLLRQLVNGSEKEQLRAATTLAQLRAERQLLEALKAPQPRAHELARRALEHVWFIQAGTEAYEQVQRAHAAAEAGKTDEALAILDPLIARFPRFAEAWNRRAAVFWQQGDYERSLRDCHRALQLNPNHYGALQGIGVCELKQGNIAEACQALRAALRIAPHDDTSQRCLRQCEELLRTYPGTRQDDKIRWL